MLKQAHTLFYMCSFLFIALSITGFAQAQIPIGRILLGGTIAYYQSKDKYASTNPHPTKQTYVTINPSAGKVIKENLVLGVEANFSSNTSVYDYPFDKSKAEGKTYGGSVFLRKYVPLLQRFYFFGQGSAVFSTSNTLQDYNPNNIKTTTESWGTALSITPGLTYAITTSGLINGNKILGRS